MQHLFLFSLFFLKHNGSYEKIVVENAIKSINLIKKILQNHSPTLGHYEGIGDTKKIKIINTSYLTLPYRQWKVKNFIDI